MAVCPKCSTDNEDVDFCVNCGTYLRWDPTRLQPAVKLGDLNPAPPAEPEAPAAAAPAAPPEAAPPLTLRPPPPPPAAAPPPPPPPPAEPPPPAVDIPVPVMRTMDMPVVRAGQPLPPGMENMPNLVTPEAVQITPTYPELPGEEQKLIVEAGGHAHLPTLVRNQSGIVDNYEIQVRGMPDGWWNVTPPSVYLVPFGAPSGTYEQDVQINFSPPRSAEAEARLWQLEVVAVSRAQGEVAGSTKIQVQITPYEEIESELRPELVTGRRRGEFALMVRNRANAPLDIVITAVDTQNALAFDFAKSQFTAEPGRRDGTTFSAKAKKHHWIGRPNDKRFEVYSRAATGQSTAKPLTGVFRQKPWIPYWVPIVVPAIIAGAALLYSLIPHKTTVPALRGRSAAAAAIILQKAHLKAPSPPFKEVPSSHIPAGFVVSQSPKAGSHVKNGTAVTFTVAEPLVPNLRRADARPGEDQAAAEGPAARLPGRYRGVDEEARVDHQAAPRRRHEPAYRQDRADHDRGRERAEDGAGGREARAPGSRRGDHAGRAHRGSAVALARAGSDQGDDLAAGARRRDEAAEGLGRDGVRERAASAADDHHDEGCRPRQELWPASAGLQRLPR